MEKNKTGGNKAKKFARKNINQDNVTKKNTICNWRI